MDSSVPAGPERQRATPISGEAFEKLRREKGMTYLQLAAASGISDKTLRGLKRTQRLREKHIGTLTAIFGVPREELVVGMGAIAPFPEETGGFVDSFRCRASNSGGCFGQRGSYPGQWFAKTLTQKRIPHDSLYRPDRVRGNGRLRRIQGFSDRSTAAASDAVRRSPGVSPATSHSGTYLRLRNGDGSDSARVRPCPCGARVQPHRTGLSGRLPVPAAFRRRGVSPSAQESQPGRYVVRRRRTAPGLVRSRRSRRASTLSARAALGH